MYEIDDQDTVHELTSVPPSSIGAPIPVVLSDEHRLLLAYYLEAPAPDWNGTTLKIVGPDTDGEPVAVVEFEGYWAYMFGAPNDEAFDGHPLADRGLYAYGVFEVSRSSWIRRLERINSVHEHHRPDAFARLRHYVFAFHDSTFECVARGFKAATIDGPMEKAVLEMQKRLWHAA